MVYMFSNSHSPWCHFCWRIQKLRPISKAQHIALKIEITDSGASSFINVDSIRFPLHPLGLAAIHTKFPMHQGMIMNLDILHIACTTFFIHALTQYCLFSYF